MTGRHQIRSLMILLFAVLALAIALVPVSVAQGASSANLSIASSGTVLTGSRNNTLTIEISNVGQYLREFDVALQIPPPLVLFGDNHWIRSSFVPGEAIRADLTIFAPSSAAGTTSQGSIVATYKVVGETVLSTETHALSFLVRGWIDMKVYEISISPDPAPAGAEITISGNLLNRGVVAAMYTNVTVTATQGFAEGSVTPTYVGEVDPNAPAPFSLTAVVDPAASDGLYQATILVFYRDDLQQDHVLHIPVGFTVTSQLPASETTKTGITNEFGMNQALIIGVGAVAVLVIVGVYLRKRHRHTSST